MRRLVITMGIAALLAGALPAHAQPPPGQGGGRRGMESPMRPMPPPQRDQMPQRDFQGGRDAQQDPRRGGQMSPEERRQLRRDISDHGRDVYRDRRPPQR